MNSDTQSDTWNMNSDRCPTHRLLCVRVHVPMFHSFFWCRIACHSLFSNN